MAIYKSYWIIVTESRRGKVRSHQMSEKLSCSTRFNQLLKFQSQEVFFSQIIVLLVIPEANSKIKQLRKACGCWGMQSKEKFPSSHTPIRLIAFCSTAIVERENRPVKKCKLREDQSIIIFCSCHTLSIYPSVNAMDSDAKWQIGRREAKKKRSRKKKKEEWKESGKFFFRFPFTLLFSFKEAKELKQAKGALAGFTGGRVFGIVFGTVANLPVAQQLWRISGRWNSCRGSGNTPNVELGPATCHASHVGHVFHVMIFDASFRDGKNTENACSVMNLTAGSSQSTENAFRRALGCRVSTAWFTNAVSKTHGTSVFFYNRHGSVAPRMDAKWCRCWQHKPPRFKDGLEMEIEVKDDGLEPGNRGEGWCSPALTTFQISSSEMKSFSKWSGISSGMKLEWSYPTGEMSSFWRLGASSCVFEARSLCVTGSCIRPSRRPDRVIQVQGLQLSHRDAKG